jgi:amino acid adenylation domain-containing protein
MTTGSVQKFRSIPAPQDVPAHPWNDTPRNGPRGWCVHRLVEAQARRTPDAPAVSCGGRTLTYRELDARANQAARLLRRHGVGPDVLVGVFMERSLELVVALLGVLKAGGAYVPLDPAYPRARVQLMLADTRVPVLLTQPALAGRVEAGAAALLPIDPAFAALEGESTEPVESGVDAENLSHVIYTSGSTGTPKGVMIRHSSVVELVRWAPQVLGIHAGRSVLFSTSVCFDVHVAETWVPLGLGARIVVVPNALHLASLPEGEHVDVASMVPSAAAELLRMGGIPASLRSINLAGEALRNDLAQDLYRGLPGLEQVVNVYGPTEDTTYSTWHVTERGTDRPMPIGVAITGSRIYVLDPALRPAADGATGEIWLAGAGVARGYRGRPGATAERFLPDPWSPRPGGRMYRTGDLGRTCPDGAAECLGRVDHQVKVRGFRVELGEVEDALRRHPAVADAVAAVREDLPGDRVLVGYVAAGEGAAPSPAELKAFLADRLPDYMVPTFVVVLDALPRLPNDKVDRGALPAPVVDAARAYTAPRTPAEAAVCAIWAEVLGVERVGVEDDFLELGGHSLRATQVAARLRQALGAELSPFELFELRTPAQVAWAAERAASRAHDDVPALVPADRDQPIPLSSPQQAIWFFQELSPGMRSYNFQAAIRFDGRLDVPALERALEEIVRRHEIFRTIFRAVDGEPRQLVQEPFAVRLDTTDLGGLEGAAQQAELERLLRVEFQKPFHLGRLPLVRWTLYRLADDAHVLAAVEHHFVHDGWSFGRFLQELAALYGAFAEGRESPLPPLEVQFADYAVWQREWLRSAEAARQLAWWKATLAGLPPVLELPADRPRPAEMSFQGRSLRFRLPPELVRRAGEFSRRNGVTLYMTLLAAYQALLHRYTGATEFAVGGGVANRNDRASEQLIGMIVNTFALRADLSGDPSGAELLARVRRTTYGAYANREIPFVEVVEAVQPERRLSHLPVFQTAFSFHDAPYPSFQLPGARLTVTEALSNESAKFDLQVITIPRGSQQAGAADEVTMIWEYATDLFEEATVRRMEAHYRALLAAMLADPRARVSELPLLAQEERHTVVQAWSGRDGAAPAATVDALFAEHATRTPDAVALEWEDGRMTYAELDARSARLARHLRARGVRAGTRVGVCLERGPDAVAALLAVLKAGGAFVPLDPSYPAERLAFMLADTAVPVLVTVQALAQRLPAHGARTVLLDRDAALIAAQPAGTLRAGTGPEWPAYVMYTSGSTGTPKGIAVPHRAIVRLVRGTDFLAIDRSDVFLHLAPVSFDASTLELWGPLLNGARLAIYPAGQTSVEGIAAAVRRHGVTTLWLTAGLFHLVVDENIRALAGVRQLVAGGDVLSVPHVRRVLAELPGTTVINGYGPTENTTFTCCHPVRALAEGAASVPIGRPVAGTRVYVLDGRMQPVPVGVPGELYAGGAGLALGYLNRPALTAEKFVPSPFAAGELLYRTGDRVRWTESASLEFLGRTDAQVKVRGFRIEPGEIESALRTHPAVTDAAVVARRGQGQAARLVAYVTGDRPEPEALRAHLAERLPEYMRPATIVVLERLPLTANGKVDAAALPEPEVQRAEAAAVPPRDATEGALAELFAGVLRVESVGVFDNFFALGGDSLLCMQVVARAREAGMEISVRDVFEHQTVAGLATAVSAADADDAIPRLEPAHDEAALLASLDDMSPDEMDALLASLAAEA